MEVGGKHHDPVILPQEWTPVPTECEAVWGSRAGLDVMSKYLDLAKIRISDHPARS